MCCWLWSKNERSFSNAQFKVLMNASEKKKSHLTNWQKETLLVLFFPISLIYQYMYNMFLLFKTQRDGFLHFEVLLSLS